VTIVATSRVPLRVTGEHEFPVSPLSPDEAMTLFVERARAVRPMFELMESNQETIATVCRELDGLPLAIELAAARSKVLSPSALLARLSHGLGLLTGGPRDQPARLQTMRDAIAWSYDLLSAEEQQLFRRLAIFAGGFTLEAAEAVADGQTERRADGQHDDGSPLSACPPARLPVSVFDGIAALVDGSLLRQAENADGEPRFGMLETIREYGLEQLAAMGEVHQTRKQHATWCLELVESAWPAFASRTDQEPWLDRLAAEHDNLRAALAWLEEIDDIDLALRLGGRLFWFWYVRGYLNEGRAWLERTLARSAGAPPAARAQALLGLAVLAHWQGDDERAVPCLQESLALWNDLDDDWGITFTLGMLGIVAEDTGEFARAVPYLEQSLERARAANDLPSIALALDHLGVVAWGQGDVATAVPHWQDALLRHREAGDTWGASISLSYLGMVACERGEFQTSDALLRESLLQRWGMGTKEDVAHGLANFAALAAAQGHHARAARLFGAAEAIQEAIGNLLKEPERTFYERAVAVARDGLDQRTFASSWTAGRALRLEDAVSEALAAPIASGGRDPQSAARRSTAAYSLTARELEVLPLLVAGQTDRQIGESLFISPRTAQVHVASILGKLGVATRAAAAALAVRDGLVDESPPPA
jgi:predicted ATPase/DNA-binding CsgD family transcriptional regulator